MPVVLLLPLCWHYLEVTVIHHLAQHTPHESKLGLAQPLSLGYCNAKMYSQTTMCCLSTQNHSNLNSSRHQGGCEANNTIAQQCLQHKHIPASQPACADAVLATLQTKIKCQHKPPLAAGDRQRFSMRASPKKLHRQAASNHIHPSSTPMVECPPCLLHQAQHPPTPATGPLFHTDPWDYHIPQTHPTAAAPPHKPPTRATHNEANVPSQAPFTSHQNEGHL